MEDFIQIIAALAGLSIYWLLSNRANASKKPKPNMQGGAEPMPTPKRAPMPEPEDYFEYERPSPPPRREYAPPPPPAKKEEISFEQLLEQFGKPSKTAPEPHVFTPAAVDDEFVPPIPIKTPKFKSVSEITPEELRAKAERKNVPSKKTGQGKTGKGIFKPGTTARDAFIMSEIFARKEF